MLALLLPVSAIAPSLLLMHYFQSSTRYPVPRKTLWSVFALGALSTLLIVAIFPMADALKAIDDPWLRGTLEAFLTAAIPEEILKLGVLFALVVESRDLRAPIDGMIFGAAASLGFATLENVLYVLDSGFGTAVLRALTAVPAHAFSGAILGYFVARYKAERDLSRLVVGVLIVMLLHGVYDAPLLVSRAMNDGYSPSDAERGLLGVSIVVFTFGALAVEIGWARRLLRQLREAQDGPATRARAEREAQLRALRSTESVDHALLVVGGLLVSVGALFLWAVLASVAFDDEPAMDTLGGGLLIGAPPLALGLWLFLRGTKRSAARQAARRALQ